MPHKDVNTGIIEGNCGSRNFVREQIPEQEGEIYAEMSSWIIFFNEEKDRVYIDTTNYHPGYLCFTKEALEKLLAQLKK